MGRAEEDSGRAAEDLSKVKDLFRRTIDERSWPSVPNYVLCQAKDNALATRLSHSKKIEKFPDRQDSSLANLHRKTVKKILDDIKMPGWMNHLLSIGPKHPVRNKFNEVHLTRHRFFFVGTEEA